MKDETAIQYTSYQRLEDGYDFQRHLTTRMVDWLARNGRQPYGYERDYVVKMEEAQFFGLVVNAIKTTMRKVDGISASDYDVVESFLSPDVLTFNVRKIGTGSETPFVIEGDLMMVVINGINDQRSMPNTPQSTGDPVENCHFGKILTATICATGHKPLVATFNQVMEAAMENAHLENKISLIQWCYEGSHGMETSVFPIQKDWDIHQSYYPWINVDPKEYYRRFLASRAQILILFGAPGTGKTSFIRDMICETNLNAYISYDTKILSSDATFVSYLTQKFYNAIILEDADDFLTSDRADNNKVIAKILNISDGLIKLPRKKLIFSSNLDSIKRIDPAIVRPGRCFDVMEFRPLRGAEIAAAAKDVGVTAPDKDVCTLAELFALKVVRDADGDPLTTRNGEAFESRNKMGFA